MKKLLSLTALLSFFAYSSAIISPNSTPSIGGPLSGVTDGSIIFGGSGNFAQDNANLFWDDTNNRVGIGTTLPKNQLHLGQSTINASLLSSYQGLITGYEGLLIQKSSSIPLEAMLGPVGAVLFLAGHNGTSAAPTTVNDLDVLAQLASGGWTGTNLETASSIVMQVDGTPSATHVPSSIIFGTDNGSSFATRMALRADGKWGLGTGSPQAQAHISDGVSVSSSLRTFSSSATRLALSSTASAVQEIVSAGSPTLRFTKSTNTVASPSSVIDTSVLGDIIFSGYDGSTSLSTARIKGIVNGAVSVGSIPTDIDFVTGTDALATTAFKIKSDHTLNVAAFSSAGLVHNASSGDLSSSTLVNGDVSASAAIAYSKLASMSTGQILLGNAGTPTATTLGGDATVGATGTLTIANSAITNAKVSASAAIDFSKLASLTSAHLLVGSAGNVATDVAVTGDVTITNAGVTAIGATKVTNAMLAGSIDLTTKVTGALPIANGGTNNASLGVTAGGVIYADGSKLANTGAGTSGQYLKSNAGSAPAFASFTAPTVQKFTSGSGTYTTPANVLYIRVRLIGGGGGGAGSGTAAGTAAGTGGDTTFGTTLLSGSGGVGGAFAGTGGAGGAASLGTGPVGQAVPGGGGGNGGVAGVTAVQNAGGGGGGNGIFGGGAQGGTSTGASGATNSGAGGSGAGGAATTNTFGGSGGGSGGGVNAIITSPSATYSYAVGAAGTAGGAGTSGNAGGAGAAGVIVVEEYFQ